MFVLNKVVEFHRLNLRALWFICVAEFSAIKFYPVTITLRCSNLEGRVDVRGPTFNQSSHIKHCQTPVFLFLCSQYSFSIEPHSFSQTNTSTSHSQTSGHNPQCLNTAPLWSSLLVILLTEFLTIWSLSFPSYVSTILPDWNVF